MKKMVVLFSFLSMICADVFSAEPRLTPDLQQVKAIGMACLKGQLQADGLWMTHLPQIEDGKRQISFGTAMDPLDGNWIQFGDKVRQCVLSNSVYISDFATVLEVLVSEKRTVSLDFLADAIGSLSK